MQVGIGYLVRVARSRKATTSDNRRLNSFTSPTCLQWIGCFSFPRRRHIEQQLADAFHEVLGDEVRVLVRGVGVNFGFWFVLAFIVRSPWSVMRFMYGHTVT